MEIAILKKLGKYVEPKLKPEPEPEPEPKPMVDPSPDLPTESNSPPISESQAEPEPTTTQSRRGSNNSLASGPSDELERLRQTPDSSIKPTINQTAQKIEKEKVEKTDKVSEIEKTQTPPRSSSCILL